MGLWSPAPGWKGGVVLGDPTAAGSSPAEPTFQKDFKQLLRGSGGPGLQSRGLRSRVGAGAHPRLLSPAAGEVPVMTVKGGPPALSPSPCHQFLGSHPLLKAALGGSGPGLSDGVSPHPTAPTPRPGRAGSGAPQLGCRSEGAKPQTHILLPTLCQLSLGQKLKGGVLEQLQKEGLSSPIPLPLSAPLAWPASGEVRQGRELPCKAGAQWQRRRCPPLSDLLALGEPYFKHNCPRQVFVL